MGMSHNAYVGWGVSLRDTNYGEGAHESTLDVDLFMLANEDRYDGVLTLIYGGHCDYGFPVIFIKRSYYWANWGSEVVDHRTLFSDSTEEEINTLNSYLDEAGFTGDRELKMLLVASYG
jgi:hypothetical protein